VPGALIASLRHLLRSILNFCLWLRLADTDKRTNGQTNKQNHGGTKVKKRPSLFIESGGGWWWGGGGGGGEKVLIKLITLTFPWDRTTALSYAQWPRWLLHYGLVEITISRVMYKSFYDDGASRRARSLEGNELRDGWRETQKCLKTTRRLGNIYLSIGDPGVKAAAYHARVFGFNSSYIF